MSQPPEGAFSHAMGYSSIDWETWFPGHCYICHVANAPEAGSVPHDQEFSPGAGTMTCLPGCRGCAHEEDTSACGQHCEGSDSHGRGGER